MGKIRKLILSRNQEIKDGYLKAIKEEKLLETIMDELAKEHAIGKFYIRTILKEQGIEISRKTEYDRSDRLELSTRDSEIVDLFNLEIDPDEIAAKFEITSTRVRQILRDKLGKSFKTPKLKNKLDDIKKDLHDGMSYELIVDKYGKNIIKQIKYNLNFNVFKKSLEYKIKDIVKMSKSGKPPKDIAKKHSVTRDYVYTILHGNGIRSKISTDDKTKRDKIIVQAKKDGMNVDDIAKKHKLTSTMVRIILSKEKVK